MNLVHQLRRESNCMSHFMVSLESLISPMFDEILIKLPTIVAAGYNALIIDYFAVLSFLPQTHFMSWILSTFQSPNPIKLSTVLCIISIKVHLRDFVHDERLEKRWSYPTVLPLVLFAINDKVNSETGVRPFDAKFGIGAWIRLAAPDKYRLVSRAKFYQPGDLILYRYPVDKPKPSKLSSPFLGPYEVIFQTKNDVEARHLSMGNIRTFHVTEVKLFVGPREVARQLSYTDANQFDILEFRNYIGDPAKRTTCEFEVIFQDGATLWLPWSNDIFNTVQYETFCRAKRELNPLLFTAAESRIRIKSIRAQAITTVQPGDTAYMDLRNIKPYWYEGLELDQKYEILYLVQISYGEWMSPNTHKKIRASMPVFHSMYSGVDNYFVTFYGYMRERPAGSVLVDTLFLSLYPHILPPTDLLDAVPKKP
eukprot:gene5421-10856_t